MKDLYAALENLVWLTQLGLSMLLPLVVFLWLAWWLVSHVGAPYWVYLPAILLGLGSGAQSFRLFARRLMKRAERNKGPAGYNRHD